MYFIAMHAKRPTALLAMGLMALEVQWGERIVNFADIHGAVIACTW